MQHAVQEFLGQMQQGAMQVRGLAAPGTIGAAQRSATIHAVRMGFGVATRRDGDGVNLVSGQSGRYQRSKFFQVRIHARAAPPMRQIVHMGLFGLSNPGLAVRRCSEGRVTSPPEVHYRRRHAAISGC
jgi:hypothetical protein